MKFFRYWSRVTAGKVGKKKKLTLWTIPPIKTSVCFWDLVELKRARKEEISVTHRKAGTEKGVGEGDADRNIIPPWRWGFYKITLRIMKDKENQKDCSRQSEHDKQLNVLYEHELDPALGNKENYWDNWQKWNYGFNIVCKCYIEFDICMEGRSVNALVLRKERQKHLRDKGARCW